eukprot:CAMPEP_0182932654 /NCGR_PEP_ID=MMETSP0105_2-20130417/31895_1 /TAXON_ID=81532 ORGANISM="Acanthoeca-like sp., Strain 10tr" /NCGR_SAMPLE_ID=MMETSP0105_2 /ASSEMBLY_ACC=CAM_ASM_000205 /LENGTH=61 /DNA_ID=CAMNT_0025071281 /DNA_START=31 /DNA_END=213 /DNA_ORIENTATION=+
MADNDSGFQRPLARDAALMFCTSESVQRGLGRRWSSRRWGVALCWTTDRSAQGPGASSTAK